MIGTLITLVLTVPSPFERPIHASVSTVVDDQDLEKKIAAAGRDVAKLIELATASAGQAEAAKKIYKKVLEIDPANEAAHKGLNHQYYDKKWFESFAELAKYKREEAARMKGKGLARYKDEWVPEADFPFLSMGWTKDEKGTWRSPLELAEEKQVAEWKAAGYQFRADDNSWIAPADMPKWTALQWKCGDEWVDLVRANEYHSKIEQHWEIAGEHYTIWTTCDWEGGHAARWHADKSYPELVRIFGVEPTRKPHFFVLNGLEQYNRAAGGNPPILPEAEGFSSLHGAYFADLFFGGESAAPQYAGCGVSYWDRKDTKISRWGPYWLRWAAAQSFVDAIDPSWTTIAGFITGTKNEVPAYAAAFWAEKKIPRWLRYGAAAYVERFLKDPEAAAGADPWTLRAFAFAEIKKAGGLRKLDDVFAFELDLKDTERSTRLYFEAGLLVAYMLDGAADDKEITSKLDGFRASLKSGTKADAASATTALQKALAKHERDVKKFAGL